MKYKLLTDILDTKDVQCLYVTDNSDIFLLFSTYSVRFYTPVL